MNIHRVVAVSVAAGMLAAASSAQEILTLRGEIVEVSCYSKLGTDKATGASHIACAKDCVAKGQPLGILTDGDGLVKITGDYADNTFAKLAPYIGRDVEVAGTPDRYLDYSRAIRVTKLTPLASKPLR
jgi:hypothetical protein